MRTWLLDEMVKAYEPATWRIPADFLEKSHFERSLARVDMSSSPGYPYCVDFATNKSLFKTDKEGKPDPAMVDLFYTIVCNRLRDRDCDPIRCFIKPEPHKVSKLRDGRLRLIASVSVVDQIIDHMLFAEMNEALIENWIRIPSKVGWSPYYGGWRHIPKGWLAADKSCWDWTAKPWLFDLVLQFRMRMCENLDLKWVDLATWRYKCLIMDPTWITTGGILLKQKRAGVMKSGCVNTIADNSLMQYLLHLRVCKELGVDPGPLYAMGDDTYQEPPERPVEYRAKLEEFCLVKEFDRKREFCGMRFCGMNRVEPLYKGKHAFNLLHMASPEELSISYGLLYHRSVESSYIDSFFAKLGVKTLSTQRRDLIFDGE